MSPSCCFGQSWCWGNLGIGQTGTIKALECKNSAEEGTRQGTELSLVLGDGLFKSLNSWFGMKQG